MKPVPLSWSCLAGSLLILLGTSSAAAHVRLIDPPPRVDGQAGNNQLKTGPCGQVPNGRTTTVTEFEPGATIEVVFAEYIDHPSYYRVAFDVEGDDSFPHRPNMSVSQQGDDPTSINPVSDLTQTLDVYILDYLLDDVQAAFGSEETYSMMVTLPNVECENCTLQLIQFMYNSPSPYYFQCADVALRATNASGAGGTASTGTDSSTVTSATSIGFTASSTGTSTSTNTGTGTGTGAGGFSATTTTGSGGLPATATTTSTNNATSLGTSGGTTTTNASVASVSTASTTGSGGGTFMGGTNTAGEGPPVAPPASEGAGCSCRVAHRSSGGGWFLALLALGWLGVRRRVG